MIEKIPLNSLKFFYFVARYSSVTIAAKKLFVTQSAVSKQIYNLEELLDIELFERRNKSLILTKEGEILFNCAQMIFNQLDECLIGLTKNKIEQKQLVLSCEPTISMKWLIPRLVEFKKLGHDFEVVLLTDGGDIDFEKNNIDIAIRRNDFDWGAHIFSEKIGDEYIVAVQASHLPKTQELLISKSRPNFFKKLNQLADLKYLLKTYSKTELEHFYLCLEGCLAGLGATIISIYMIEKELDLKSLDQLTQPIQDGSSYYLLSHTSFTEDPRKIIFLNWLKNEMTQSQMNYI
ncbi:MULTISPECIES: LysR family transcriptional regulator [Acinetobacter]|uniref:LysR family transcriptional regulator n=1 Tax=Acinetobacter chengduensis TaxID=2420890 RepID=A0ABX9TSS7_9GAMM|nr:MULTISPECIES: LysR family transcriptional regulator [Acinetobacter]MBI1450508.1 LysR family transcriptional regulator [Acinetobacter sp. FL51]RKG44916.1 LysR family transcriptional regulator [Acinetobacter sp. WCHAc060007]RLL18423.1 LysR family transcriptional regulator [Acinetobacter chengduensis]